MSRTSLWESTVIIPPSLLSDNVMATHARAAWLTPTQMAPPTTVRFRMGPPSHAAAAGGYRSHQAAMAKDAEAPM